MPVEIKRFLELFRASKLERVTSRAHNSVPLAFVT
jgi:hypothetical protein